MNTINPVRLNLNLKSEPQSPVVQPTSPVSTTFKGVIGDKVVKQIANKEAVTVASILALVGGMLGLSKDKVADVMESLVAKVKGLMGENAELEKQNLELKKTLVNTKGERDIALKEVESLNAVKDSVIEHYKSTISEKDAKIAELQKYEAMARIKSLDDTETVMPDQAIAVLKEIAANDEAAHNSLFSYIMSGKGQEEFLKQIERNEILLKARKDRVTEIPEVKKEIDAVLEDGCRVLGYDSYNTACEMLGRTLAINPKGAYLNSPALYKQVKENAEALINPLRQESYYYNTSVDKAMKESLEFQKRVEDTVRKLEQAGWEYESEVLNGASAFQSYKTFVNRKEGHIRDYSLSDLSAGFLGVFRLKDLEGNLLINYSKMK